MAIILEVDLDRFNRPPGFGPRRLDVLVAGQSHAHAPLAMDLGFAEEAQLGVDFAEGPVEDDVAILVIKRV